MKIILLKDDKNLGKAGEMVDVKDGFARNFLLPKNVAIEATPENVANWEVEQAKLKEAEEFARSEAEKLKEVLEAQSLKISAKGGEGGRLFGSITNAEIARNIKDQLNIDLDRKKIELEENIKSEGLHEVPVRLYPEVIATLKVEIEAL